MKKRALAILAAILAGVILTAAAIKRARSQP